MTAKNRIKNHKILFLLEIIAILCLAYVMSFIITNYRIIKDKSVGIKTIETYSFVDNTLNIQFDNATYINKIKLNYKSQNNNDWIMDVSYLDIYGTLTNKQISGTANKNIDIFSESLKLKIKNIKITFNNELADINNIHIDNNINYFSETYVFLIMLLVTIFIIFKFKNYLFQHLEWLFALIASFAGIQIIIYTPVTTGSSWDDQIHFAYVYGLVNKYNTNASIEAADCLTNTVLMFNTREEKLALKNYLNSINVKNENNPAIRKLSYNKITYIHMSLAYLVGNIFNMTFSSMFILGKLFNLLFYILICFFAIKKVPIGKLLMLTIALIPTTIFMAANYSYDPPITALILLGTAYYLYEYFKKEEKLSITNAAIIMISLVVASCPKAIYIPLLLLLLLLPKEKFESNKKCLYFKICICIIFLLMMATFLLPTVTNQMEADMRGGATSVSGQLKLILSSPISFAKVFYNNAGDLLFSRVIGEGTINFWAYLGGASTSNIYYLFLSLIILAVVADNPKMELSRKSKMVISIICLLIYCFTWGALYLTFTPVGATSINGVQGRYFIPLLYPTLILFITQKIHFERKSEKLELFISISLVLILSIMLIDCLILKMC